MEKYYKWIYLSSIFFLLTNNLKSQSQLNLLPPQIVKDTFYGKVYEEHYRFLEDTKDSVVDNWLHQQTDKSLKVLRRIPNWKTILIKQKESRGKKPLSRYLKITKNDNYFYLKKEVDEKLYKLYYRKSFQNKEELLFDPKDYNKKSGYNYTINYLQPNWDGSKIVMSFTKNDEEISELAILDVKTRKLHPEVITNCLPSSLGGVSWLTDNSGFFYTHIPETDKTSKDFILNTASVLYKLGSNPKKLNIIFSAKNNPEINIEPADFPIIYNKPEFDGVILGRIGRASLYSDYYYTKINNKGEVTEWVPLYKKEDLIKNLTFDGKDFYFLSALNASNFKLCKTSIDTRNFINPEILVMEEADAVITDFAVTQSGIYYVKTKNGVDARLYSLKNGFEQEVPIPRPSGNIIVSSKSVNSNDWWIQIEGWSNHRTRYYFDPNLKSFIEQNLYSNTILSGLNDVVVEEIEVPSHDGVKVPLSIIYKKGTKLDGNNRVFMDGYGCIGTSMTPYPIDFLKHWIREGGIYAVTHVRGGGEKGEAWHKGGYKQTKPNTWKDFIACTEYLIKKRYSKPNKIAVWSGSGGGILIARAITERPDLYKVAIIYAGLINMLRAEFGLNGQNLIREFGTVNDSSEFYALLEMDACQHLKKGMSYPSILLQAGANDSRVPIWHSAKFAAGMQAANASNNPVLLSVNFDIGHGVNFTVEDWDKIVADVISFALWQTKHPDFQLKEN